MPSLKLQSSDGEVFSVETQIAKQSNTIRTMLEGKIFLFLLSMKVDVYLDEIRLRD